jgi:hypothetical protein
MLKLVKEILILFLNDDSRIAIKMSIPLAEGFLFSQFQSAIFPAVGIVQSSSANRKLFCYCPAVSKDTMLFSGEY